MPTSQVARTLRPSTPIAPHSAPRNARSRSVLNGNQRNRQRKSATSRASATATASSEVTTAAVVLPASPIQLRNVPDTEVATLVTAIDTNPIRPSPARTPISFNLRVTTFPTSTGWCHTILIASRNASIHASPASRRPNRPSRPTPTFALPMLAMSSLSASPGR